MAQSLHLTPQIVLWFLHFKIILKILFSPKDKNLFLFKQCSYFFTLRWQIFPINYPWKDRYMQWKSVQAFATVYDCSCGPQASFTAKCVLVLYCTGACLVMRWTCLYSYSERRAPCRVAKLIKRRDRSIWPLCMASCRSASENEQVSPRTVED